MDRIQTGRGFTLIELLVVISLISLLASTILASLGAAKEKAKIAKVKAELRSIVTSIEALETDTGYWPGTLNLSPQPGSLPNCYDDNSNEVTDLNSHYAGLTNNDAHRFPGWRGPYVTQVPKDPWGGNYFFDTDYWVDKDTHLPSDRCKSGGNPTQNQNCLLVVAAGSCGNRPSGLSCPRYNPQEIIFVMPVRQDCRNFICPDGHIRLPYAPC